ncbi:MAG TPA: DNA polymerase/3'-5' exonuclease PolX [Pseudogracilibacillus sp.]|nr:DNA polymerase/3'-5' exonuclease PolX [Pseudogracilibacillus sp.]
MKELDKKDVIQHLEKVATYLELQGSNPYRIAAYRKASQGLEKDVRSLKEIDDIGDIPGIGKGTKELIDSFLATGTSELLTTLEEEVPAGLLPLLKLPGLGGKRLALLYKELGVTDEASLKKAIETGKLEQVKGMGKKTAQNILEALENQGERPERLPVHLMLRVSEEIEAGLQEIKEIERYNVAGSLRRLRETIKDIDYIIAATEKDAVRKQLINLPNVKEIIANGTTKVSVTIQDEYDINIDFRIVDQAEFASTLHHFTGSKDHNVSMRQLAKERDEKINEYGVEKEATGEIVHFDSEADFYQHFDLHYIPPEMRENTNELEIFQQAPPLLSSSDILGDLHMHTTWSDGAHSVEEMVNYARKLGYSYVTITDHSKFLQVANGLNEKRLRKQGEEIHRLNEKYKDIEILRGVEMDILPNGELDFEDSFLAELDLVIAAIHSSFNQTEAEIMKRIDAALNNPFVDIIAHPTGRIIGRREGYQVNVAKMIQKAKETNTALELNANPQRFDLTTTWLKAAQEAGVPVAINTDAHNQESMHLMNYGIRRANRAFLKPENIVNTWSKAKLLSFIQRNKGTSEGE